MRLLIVGNSLEHHVGAHFLAAAIELGWDVDLLDVRRARSRSLWINRVCDRFLGRRPFHLDQFSREIVARCRSKAPDLLLATGVAPIHSRALDAMRSMGARTVNFLTDDPWNPRNGARFFWQALRSYDLVANPRQANLEQLRRHGCRRVEYLPFAYNPQVHFPEEPAAQEERRRFACEAAIIGGADEDRVPLARALAAAGLGLALYGGYWDRQADLKRYHRGDVHGRDLRWAVGCAGAQVCMVRRANRDGHAMRSLEFPAMGACVLAEDTPEHRELYGQDGEAVLYWRDPTSLVSAAQAIKNDSALRHRLTRAIYSRIVKQARHTYTDRLTAISGMVQAA